MSSSKEPSEKEYLEAFSALFEENDSTESDQRSTQTNPTESSPTDPNPNRKTQSIFKSPDSNDTSTELSDSTPQEKEEDDLSSSKLQTRQPISGYLWDRLPRRIRFILHSIGLTAPISAIKSSLIYANMEKSGALLIGPPKAGKTTLITAIHRACLIPVHSEIDLRWKATRFDPSQIELTRLSLSQIISGISNKEEDNEGVEATRDVQRYDFNIEGRLRHPRHFNSTKLFDMKLSFHDGPGGAMFPEDEREWSSQSANRSRMIKDSKDAYTLIFCLDGSDKQAHSMQTTLARILPMLQDYKRHDGYLPPRRVVILLNKIDQVATDFYKSLYQKYDAHSISLTPKIIAEQMDPLQMAIECLGYASIKMIRDSMRSDAELAIGLISTWGFKDNGNPLVDANGQPIFASLLGRGHTNDFVAQWRPFGVREVLVYLATGRTSPMIHIVQPSDLNKNPSEAIAYEF